MNPTSGVSQEIQQWVRIGLYYFWGWLFSHGYSVTQDRKELVASALGFLLTMAWTIWGSNLKNLLARAKAHAGVDEINVRVDDTMIDPNDVNKSTPRGINATGRYPNIKAPVPPAADDGGVENYKNKPFEDYD